MLPAAFRVIRGFRGSCLLGCGRFGLQAMKLAPFQGWRLSWRQVKGPANGAAYVTGPNNQLLFDGVFSYCYDPEGNRTARFIDVNANGLLDAGDTAVTTYAWDHRNRLTCVTDYGLYGDPGGRLSVRHGKPLDRPRRGPGRGRPD